MKIGIISSQMNQTHTGIGNYIYNVVNELNNLNTDNEIYLINYKYDPNFCNEQIILSNPFPYFKAYLWHIYLVIVLRHQKLDIIHNPAQVPTLFKIWQKSVITVHDITPFLYPEKHPFSRSFVNRLFFPITLKFANKIIAVSENTKKDLISYFGTPENKIKVIPNGVDKSFQLLDYEDIDKVKNKYSLRFPFILYVGTLEPRKNIPSLIMAFNKLKEKKITHRLVIAGKKGWKYKDIFKIISKLNLQNDIIFTGYVSDEDLPGLYNAADLFVYPSIYEGFGLPPLEAMACGTPVITSNTSSLPEVVGNAGIMIDPLDIESFAESMYKVISNEDLKIKMRKKGLERAKLFSWEKCAKEVMDTYQKIYNET